jgi:hypothetical protein
MPTYLPQKLEILDSKMPVYLVKNDQMYSGGYNTKTYKEFVQILQKYVDAEVMMFDADKQIEVVEKYIESIRTDRTFIISLDKWYKGDIQFSVSRNFKNDSQTTSEIKLYTDIVKLQEFLNSKSYDKIIIVDDDIVTGSTVNFVKNCLEKYVSPEKDIVFLSMTEIYNIHNNRPVYDIVDFRDFLTSSQNGGLYVNGSRKLYKFPEVNLLTRMKLKSLIDCIHFSMDWYDNYKVVEIGHLYMTETYKESQLEYLKKLNFSQDDNLVLFIDDVSELDKDRHLNVEKLKLDVEKLLNRTVGIVYESEMKVFLDQTIEYLKSNFSVIDVDGNIYLDKNCIVKMDKPTCFMYSLMWSLFRNGFFIDKNMKTLTVIDKKYKKLEKRVKKYLNQTKNSEYIFFD